MLLVRLVDDMNWMQDEREHHVMQQITQQYLCVKHCWKQLLSCGQEWGGLLDNLYPEMKQCQVNTSSYKIVYIAVYVRSLKLWSQISYPFFDMQLSHYISNCH